MSNLLDNTLAPVVLGFTLAVIAGGMSFAAQSSPAVSSDRITVDLAQGWERVIPSANMDTPPAEGWAPAELGELVSSFNLPDGVHEAWYRHPLEIAPEWEGKILRLHFLDSLWSTDVFLDGKRVGGHRGGFTPFEVVLTGIAKPGAHVIHVRTRDWTSLVDDPVDVSRAKRGDRLPNDRAKGRVLYPLGSHFEWFGLWQPVELRVLPAVNIEGVYIKTSYRKKTIGLEITARNESKQPIETAFSAA